MDLEGLNAGGAREGTGYTTPRCESIALEPAIFVQPISNGFP
jgi:hypothetical protein